MEKIVRSLGDVTVNNQSRKVEGYALLFNTQSRFIGWYETIERGAITQDTINRSDVFALFNHDAGKVLARSENGKGSLKLEIDDKGLKYSFDAPKTALGDELLEYLDRGDIHQSSFAFYIDFGDETMVNREYRNGDVYYTIKHIPVLVDVSPVWTPAYAETYVGKRALELAEQMRSENNNQTQTMKDIDMIKEAIDDEMAKRSCEEEEKEQDRQEETEEKEKEEVREESDEEDKEEDKDEETSDEPEKEKENEEEKEEDKDKEQERSININKNNSKFTTMKEEKFSLIKAIRAIANNQEVDAATKKVIELGAQEMRNAGLSYGGQIQIPLSVETRDGITVDGVHDDLVVTDFTNILEPLHAKNVLVNAGCKYLTGLVGDVQVPIMGAEQVGWAGEIENAIDGSGSWSHKTLQPHRLTSYIDLSKQYIVQDSLGAEQLVRNELVNALNSKLEATILSADAGTATKPAGLFYDVSTYDVSSFLDVTELEAMVEESNIFGEMKYIVSPKAKADLRNMPRSADHTRLVMEGNEIDGTPVLSTTNIAQKKFAYGDWSNVAIGQWGAIDIIVDPYTVARSGQVRIVINAYFDFKLLRDGALVYATTDVD